ncbi:hypothetical protein Fot_21029 [Forsythia ovata]|uniref:Uncharacterized protein n=1 Tax=Forsythia ovata TaxID=205694 RepID=A0ABD1UUT2_9LAMI
MNKDGENSRSCAHTQTLSEEAHLYTADEWPQSSVAIQRTRSTRPFSIQTTQFQQRAKRVPSVNGLGKIIAQKLGLGLIIRIILTALRFVSVIEAKEDQSSRNSYPALIPLVTFLSLEITDSFNHD